MDESAEKSCWGVTLWAIAVVVAVVIIGSFVMGPKVSVNATSNMTISG